MLYRMTSSVVETVEAEVNIVVDEYQVLGASEVSANLYCNSRTSVLGRLRDYLRLLMGCML